MSKGLKVVFVAYVHNIDTFNAMLKGSKEALTVLIVTHVERVESGVCGLCTQYRYIQCYVERVKRSLNNFNCYSCRKGRKWCVAYVHNICHGIALPHLCAPVVLLRPSGLSYARL